MHGIQNSGDTLDGTNAAQCLMATARPASASRQRWSDCHVPKYFPQSHPASAAGRPQLIVSNNGRLRHRYRPSRLCTFRPQSKWQFPACNSHQPANIPRSRPDSTGPPQPRIRSMMRFAPNEAPELANPALRLGRRATRQFAATTPAAAPQPRLRASSYAQLHNWKPTSPELKLCVSLANRYRRVLA